MLPGDFASVLRGKKGEMLGEMPDTADYGGKRAAAEASESTTAASAAASNGNSQRRESEGRGWRQACRGWEKKFARFGRGRSTRAGSSLCIGCIKLVGSKKDENLNMQEFFCTTLYAVAVGQS